jgi:hypothetical protein
MSTPSVAVLFAALAGGAGRLEHMPEPLVAESLTDIDGEEAGEVEIDMTALGARRMWSSSVEIEWRALARLGLGVEAGADDDGHDTDGGARVGASVPLLHRGVHLMLEGSARLPADAGELEPGEAALPYAIGLRAGWRRGRLALRGGSDLEWSADRASAVVSGAALVSFGREDRGFCGIEVLVDAARAASLALVPEAAVLLDARVPVRVGLAAPIAIDPSSGEATLAGLLRVVLELGD